MKEFIYCQYWEMEPTKQSDLSILPFFLPILNFYLG